MNEAQGKLDGIIDIEPPLIPIEGSTDIIVLGALASIFVVLMAFYLWRRHQSIRAQARRKLTQLQIEHSSRLVDDRRTAFQIAAILRIGLRLQQVSSTTPLPAHLTTHQQRWQTFIDELSTARYALATSHEDNISTLFNDANFWLRCWP